jgi:predicted ATPase
VDDNERSFYVVTGGPGSGKTTLVDALERRGYARSIEAGRGVIQDQVAVGGHALPWDDRLLFAELMLSWEMSSYHAAERAAGTVFFDRGVPDILGYLKLLDIPIPDHMHKAAALFRYERTVFIAPPRSEIYRLDRERKQDFREAVRTYEAMVHAYSALDYELAELPRVTTEEQVDFVLERIGPRRRS